MSRPTRATAEDLEREALIQELEAAVREELLLIREMRMAFVHRWPRWWPRCLWFETSVGVW